METSINALFLFLFSVQNFKCMIDLQWFLMSPVSEGWQTVECASLFARQRIFSRVRVLAQLSRSGVKLNARKPANVN